MTEPALDRPFESRTWQKAARIAAGYRIVLERDPDLGFIGHALEMPNVFADGATPDACVEELGRALAGAVAFMLEDGRKPPLPANERRTAQVNIRLTPEERLLLEESARQEGFRGVADYVRTKLLKQAS